MGARTTIVCPKCHGDFEKILTCSNCNGDGVIDVGYWINPAPNQKQLARETTKYVLLLLVVLACFVSGFAIFFWEILKGLGIIK